MKKKYRNKNLFRSFKYAFSGYLSAYKEEQNMRIHTFMAFAVLIMGLILKVSATEWLFLVLMIGLVITAEIVNTVIENLVDLVIKEQNNRVKIIKDCSAACVMIISMTALIIGLIIFVPKIIELIGVLL